MFGLTLLINKVKGKKRNKEKEKKWVKSQIFSFSFAAVASISAGNDEYVGNLIAEAMDKIGSDGVISIESSSSSETSVIIEEGMKVEIMLRGKRLREKTL